MGYRTLKQAVSELEKTGQLIRINQPIDPNLLAGAIQRRVYQAQGPALLFSNLEGCSFPAVANLFGTLNRTRYLFRDSLRRVETLVKLKIDPKQLFKHPSNLLRAPIAALHLVPKRVKSGPIMQRPRKRVKYYESTNVISLQRTPEDLPARITAR